MFHDRSTHAAIPRTGKQRPENRTKYGYDNANQLTSITYSKGGTTIGDLAYAYDAAGRRTSVSGSLATSDLPAAVTTAAHNANNQLTSWAGATLTYDLNGNLTGDGTNTYTWNARDQLASLSGGSSASFVYDGVGRRRSKTIGSTQTGFLYDGLNFVQELTGSTVNANLITGGIDEVFLRKEGSTPRHFMSDALGSVIALTDAAGAVQTQYSFEPYGKTTVSGTANTNSQRYTGREDDGTGLFYYRARYYSTTLARFISTDPMGIAAGSNFYAYVEGDPISNVDPTGEISQGLVDGVAGFGDAFLIPELIRDWGGIGSVNKCSPEYGLWKKIGFGWGFVPFAFRGLAALGSTRLGHGINHNRYLRFGPRRFGKDMKPGMALGPAPGSFHWNLSKGFAMPPIGGPGADCGCN